MKWTLLVLLTLAAGCGPSRVHDRRWVRLPDLPDREGFAGSFAGTSHGVLIVAGGANFPGAKPWEGGKKVWYDTVFVLENPNGRWKVAGRLPRPLGYGVSVTHNGGVVCVGGSNADRHFADAFRLDWDGGRLVVSDLPPLPKPVANACGALSGDDLYVIGGLSHPDATTALETVYRINLSVRNPQWGAVASLPGGGRMLATAAAASGRIWVAGGVALRLGPDARAVRHYLKDAYRLDPHGWVRIADLPLAAAASPSPAPAAASQFWVLGGDDGSQAAASDRHRGFSTRVLRYDATRDAWATAGEVPAAHVTAPCVRWKGWWVVPSGEVRPGVRSPRVWGLKPLTGE